MKNKTIGRICEGVTLASCVGLFLTVGAVENFSVSLGRGLLIIALCAGVAAVAVAVGCKEG